jgi:hypothetical protein
MIADGSLDALLAADVVEASQGIVVHDRVSLILQTQVSLIYHSVFGDRKEAIRLACELESVVHKGERSWYGLMSLLNCSLARQLVDSQSFDYSDLERGYVACTSRSMNSMALRFAARLTTVLIDDGNIDEARTWLGRAEQLSSEGNKDRPSLDYYSSQVDFALIQDDERRARSFIRKMEASAPLYESERMRNDLLMYRVRVDQMLNGTATDSGLLERLLSWHERSKSLGRHDDHVEVLWVGLRAHNRSAEASALLAEYLRYSRRESRNCHHLLRVRTGSDRAWHSVDARTAHQLDSNPQRRPAANEVGAAGHLEN